MPAASIDISVLTVVIGIINPICIVGGLVYQSGKNAQRNAALQGEIAEVKSTFNERLKAVEDRLDAVHDEQLRAPAVREDVAELKTGFAKLAEGLTTLAVVQAKTADNATEIMRTRERLHDLESGIRGLSAWREECGQRKPRSRSRTDYLKEQ